MKRIEISGKTDTLWCGELDSDYNVWQLASHLLDSKALKVDMYEHIWKNVSFCQYKIDQSTFITFYCIHVNISGKQLTEGMQKCKYQTFGLPFFSTKIQQNTTMNQ